MPSVYDLKPRFQALLRPLSDGLAARGVTANQVTISAMLLSLLAGVALALAPGNRWALLSIPLVLLLRMGLNAIDGMLAREHHQQSRLGAILNELGDVVSDAALYLPFALIPGVSGAAVVVLVVIAVIVEMTGVVAIQVGAERRYDGPMGKSDRALLFGVLAVLLAIGANAGVWVAAVIWLAVVFSVVTIVNRARAALARGDGDA